MTGGGGELGRCYGLAMAKAGAAVAVADIDFDAAKATSDAIVKAGRVRAMGVTGAKRSAVLPEVPTIAEAGVAGYEHILWGMLLVPAATPKDVVARLNREAVKALEAAEVRERYAGMGVEPAGPTR